jgi:hypothetical protein
MPIARPCRYVTFRIAHNNATGFAIGSSSEGFPLQSHRPATLRYLPILLLLLVNLVIGLAVVRDYGESWDEASSRRLADQSLEAYPDLLRGKLPGFDESDVLTYYGSAFLMAGALLSKFFQALFPSWLEIDGWHFAYFLAFQVGILAQYFLAHRWLGTWAAFGSALLFSTQPLLWGHAFINSRDIPFMAFFLASVTSGLSMTDAVLQPLAEESERVSKSTPVRLLKQAARQFLKPAVLGAGAVLGITTSIRVLGPLAGIIVTLYALYKLRAKALVFLIPYALIAMIVSFLTWPFLWGNPVIRFFESLALMSRFPFVTQVLFRGDLISGAALPPVFAPYLLSVQLTEVVPPLFLIGFCLSSWYALKGRKAAPWVLTLVWFVLPLLAIILNKSALYDNFRQLLFLLPPVFISAGVALEALFTRLKQGTIKALVLAALVLPGIYAGMRLHPYQYIYYNSYVGGVRGAFRSFELDYWGTSYREAALYLNRIAPAGARIIVSGPIHIFRDYARPDLNPLPLSALPWDDRSYDYLVLNSRRNEDQGYCASASTLKTISRDGATLTVIKKIPSAGQACP